MNIKENITWHSQTIDRTRRATQNGHKGAVLWFTGLSGSGKSTIANAVEAMLFDLKCSSYVLDGDNIRLGLNSDLTFAPEDRSENIRRISEVAKLFVDAGTLVCAAFISPYRQDRQAARQIFAAGDFIEVFIDCDLEACEARDPKGLYKKAREGKINNFTGISAPYEKPENAELTINSTRDSVEDCAEQIIAYLISKNYLNKKTT